MNPRTTLALALVAAGLFAFIWFHEVEGEAAREAELAASKRIFAGREPDDVEWIALRTSDGADVRAERDADTARWRLVAPIDFPGDGVALDAMASALAELDAVDEIDPRRRVDVRGLFTRAEEVGFVGALAVAQGRRLPRGARIVAVEASKALPSAPQGAGPILRVGDRTSIFDDALSRWLARVAGELERGGRFRWQRKLMDGGTCESTAFQLHGFRCAGMCLPLGNYHNMGERGRIAVETIRLSDLVGLVRFFEGMVRRDRDAPRRGGADPLRKRLDRTLSRGRAGLARDPFA